MGNGGGYVLGPAKGLMRGITVENAIAVIEWFHEALTRGDEIK